MVQLRSELNSNILKNLLCGCGKCPFASTCKMRIILFCCHVAAPNEAPRSWKSPDQCGLVAEMIPALQGVEVTGSIAVADVTRLCL